MSRLENALIYSSLARIACANLSGALMYQRSEDLSSEAFVIEALNAALEYWILMEDE